MTTQEEWLAEFVELLRPISEYYARLNREHQIEIDELVEKYRQKVKS